MTRAQDILTELDDRRRELGMSCGVLAKRSGLTRWTVQRVLSGKATDIRLGSLLALADALGVDLGIARRRSIRALRRQQARAKARRLAGVAQGSAALEGMGVPDKELRAIARGIEDKLVAGPSIRLWS